MNAVLLAVLFFGAYLVGGIPFGYLVARARGIDIFKEGSGNIGATNVGRVLGRRFGILVFVLDFLKGAIPTAVAVWMERQGIRPETRYSDVVSVVAGLCAFLGHIFPPYLRFRGGKGVATGAGVVTVLVPAPALAALVTWIVVVAASRYVSLASVVAALALCNVRLLTMPHPWSDENLIISAFCFIAAALVIVRHRTNIRRLFQGSESKLRDSSFMNRLNQSLHVVALGLWFGSAVMFTFVVAPLLFQTFEAAGQAKDRPRWLPSSPHFAIQDAALDGPKEQGTRAAGAAVEPIFPVYFLLQGICGLVAVVTCLSWPRERPLERVHRIRVVFLLIALAGVLAGWPVEQRVSALRNPRHAAVDHYLSQPSETAKQAMLAAKREFGAWHLGSLGLNFLTILFAGMGLALAARMPREVPQVQPTPQPPDAQKPLTMAGDDEPTIRTHVS